jgi:hypothetical protein
VGRDRPALHPDARRGRAVPVQAQGDAVGRLQEDGLCRSGNGLLEAPDDAAGLLANAFCPVGDVVSYADETTRAPGCEPMTFRGRVFGREVLLSRGELWLMVEKVKEGLE